MKKKFSRFLSWVLVVTMILGMLPTNVFAETAIVDEYDSFEDDDTIIDENVSDEEAGFPVEVDGIGYDTLQDAIDACVGGETICLVQNIELADTLLVDKSVVIEGDGFTLISSASRIMRVTNSSVDVTVQNLSMCSSAVRVGTSDIRGISVDSNTAGVNLTLVDSYIDFLDPSANDWSYGVNVTGSTSGHTITISGGAYEGANVINVWGDGHTVIVDGAELTSLYLESEAYYGACIRVEGTNIDTTATNTIFEGSNAKPISFGSDAVGGTVVEDGNTDNTSTTVEEEEAKVAQIGDTTYPTLRAAIEAANDGDTVVLLEDLTVTNADADVLDGRYATFFTVSGKSVTVDLNGKDVYCDAAGISGMLVGAFSTEDGGNLTLKDTVGGSVVEAVANGGSVYGLLVAYDPTCTLTVENGTYIADAVIDSLLYTGGAGNLIVNGGNFHLGNVATGANGKPWIFNALGANDGNYAVVNGGTFNADVSNQYWDKEVSIAEGKRIADNGDGTWTIVEDTVAMIGEAKFRTLQAAVDAASATDIITVVADAVGAGVVIDKDVTIDFGGYTYTFNEGVGSTGTESNGFQIHAGNTVTLKNGALNVAAEAADKFYILVQNYADLTVEDMILDGTNLDKYAFTDGDSYVLSNNSGTVNVLGATSITANNDGDKAFAFDVCKYMSYEAPVVNVNTTGTITGAFEVSAEINTNLNISAGTFTTPIQSDWCAEGFVPVDNGDGTYGVNEDLTYGKVACINGVYYKTLQAAIDAAVNGDTITLIKAVDEDVTVTQKNGVSITLDGAGYDYTGKMTLESEKTSTAVKLTIQNFNFVGGRIAKESKPNTSAQNITIKSCTFDGNGTESYAVLTNYVKNLTIEDCTVKDYMYGFLYANKSTTNIVVRNVTVDNCGNYGAYIVYNDKTTLENVTFNNCSDGLVLSNYTSKTVTLKDCTTPVDIKENTSNTVTINFEGVNDLCDDSFDLGQYGIDKGAVAMVGTKVYSSLTEAVAAANAGDTVKVLANAAGAGVAIDKDITIDFGGYTYTFNEGVGSTGTESNGFQILAGNTVTLKNGALNVAAEAADKFYILVQNYADLTVEDMILDGTNLDKYAFTDGDSYALSNNSGTVNVLGATSITANNDGDKAFAFDVCKYMSYEAPVVNVNTTGTITGAIEVSAEINTNLNISAGTFTTPIQNDWCAESFVPVDNGDGTYSVKVDPAYGMVACIGETYYETLQAAVDAAEEGAEITVITNAVGAGVKVNKDITIDFGGYAYSFNEGVGSKGTESNGFQILTGNTVTLKNGTLNVAAEAADKFYILVQNYANLTVENMTLDGTNLDKYAFTDGDSYTLSNNSGNVNVVGSTSIIANNDGDKAFAFDVCKKASYEAPVVNVNTTGTITGAIEVSAEINTNLNVAAGTFTTPIQNDWCAEGYMPADNGDGTYGVKVDPAYGKAACIGDVYFETLQEAIDAVKNGETIVVLDNLAEDVTITQVKNVSFTIDGNSKEFSGTINIGSSSSRIKGAETLTIKNVQFVTDEAGHNFIYSGSNTCRYAHNVTVEDCSFTATAENVVGYRYKSSYNIVMKNCTSTGLLDLVYGNNGENLTVEGCNITGVYGVFAGTISGTVLVKDTTMNVEDYGVWANSYNRTITVDNCNITAGYPIVVRNATTASHKNNVVVQGDNTSLTATNDKGYFLVMTASPWAGDDAALPAGKYDYTGVEDVKVFPTNELVARLGDKYFLTLQDAIDACVAGDNTITLLKDLAEDVTIKQTEGVNVTIDGEQKTYSGTITIHGASRYDGAETLTIKNVQFVTDEASHYFIDSNSTASAERYAHNVTVENCGFEAAGEAVNTAVAVRVRQGFNINLNGCDVQNMHSALQAYGCTGLTAESLQITGGKNGLSVGTSTNVRVEACAIDVDGYGVRADGTGAYDMTVIGSDIKAELPVVVRKTTGAYQLTVDGSNLTGSNEKAYGVIFTNGDDGTYEEPTGAFEETISEDVKVYPTSDYVASINGKGYFTLQAAVDAVKNGETIVVLKDLAENVTVKQKESVSFTIDGNNTQYSGMITVQGMNRAMAKETLDIKNFNFVTEEDGHTFIYAYDRSTSVRYPHNVTVDNCTFTTEAENVVGLRLRQFFNFKVTNCTSKGLLDLVYAYNGTGPLVIDNVNIEGENGIFFGEAKGLTVSNSTIKAEMAGILGRVTAGSATVDNCNITAYVPIMISEINDNDYTFKVNVTGANTHIVGTNEKGYWGGLCDGLDADDNMLKPHSSYELNLGEDVNLEEVKFYPVQVKETTVAMIGDVQYDTLDKAFAAAVDGDTVVLVKDCAQAIVVVPAGVTFDLNGHYVTADNFLSFGEVKDDADVVGGVVIDVDTKKAFTKIQEDNEYLPIYDTTAGCYRFFSYKLVYAGAYSVANDANAVSIYYRLLFDNVEAYDVLATTTNSAFSINVKLDWGTPVMVQHTFSDSVVKTYANDVVKNGYNTAYALRLTVRSLNTLEGKELFAQPSLESVTEVVCEGTRESVYK